MSRPRPDFDHDKSTGAADRAIERKPRRVVTWPAIDHSGLSPSGRVSKRARKAWQAREAARLFPPGTFPAPTTPQPSRAESLRANAARLRDLAGRGMSPRKFAREAARLEAEAAALEAAPRCGTCFAAAGRVRLRVAFTPGRALLTP